MQAEWSGANQSEEVPHGPHGFGCWCGGVSAEVVRESGEAGVETDWPEEFHESQGFGEDAGFCPRRIPVFRFGGLGDGEHDEDCEELGCGKEEQAPVRAMQGMAD